MFIHKFDALQARGLCVVKQWALYAISKTLLSVWICTGKLSDGGCWLIFLFWESSWMCPAPCHNPCWGSFYISRTFYYVCMTKLRPGVRLLLAPLRALVAAYQRLLVSSNITHNCVGNDSSYSLSVLCFLWTVELTVCWIKVHMVAFEIVWLFPRQHRYHPELFSWYVSYFHSQLNVYAI